MIEVIAIPVINRPDLLAEAVASIDHPTRVLLIIDNSADLGMGFVAEDALPACVERLVVTEPPGNLGVAASWNLAIRSYPKARWWGLVNGDVTIGPGDLATLDGAVRSEPRALHCLVEFAAFAISPEVVDEVGFFDENYYPVFCEDSDYRRRCELAGIPVLDLPSRSGHVGSVSYRDGPHAADNARTYPANVDYYRAKWGGWIGEERYTSPFDGPFGLDYWRLDRARLAAQQWRTR